VLFEFQGQKCIFIHIPKTGGNTVQSFLLDSGLSLDEKVAGGFRDGVNRFEVRGGLTRSKHQPLSTYFLLDPSLKSLSLYSSVRRPFERMVSLYFSPHRAMVQKPESGEYVLRSEMPFDEREFLALVHASKPAFQYLMAKDMRYSLKLIRRFPRILPILRERVESRYRKGVSGLRLQVFRLEDLRADFSGALGLQLPAESRNVSPYREQARRVLESRELRRYVEDQTIHGLDLSIFYA
jgi:hypothetical protein